MELSDTSRLRGLARASGSLRVGAAVLATIVGGTGCVFAQDSTSRNSDGGNGLPGDAISAYGPQRLNYVVDLAPLQGSFGTVWGIGPVAKSLRVASGRFNAAGGPVVVSADVVRGSAFSSGVTYRAWTGPTLGVNSAENIQTGVTNVAGPASATALGLALLDFDEQPVTPQSVLTNAVTSAVITFDPSQPSRLYVSRGTGVINAASGATDTSQLGLGAIDAAGNTIVRGDGFNALATSNVLPGDNALRVRMRTASATPNLLSAAGLSVAGSGDLVVSNSADLLAVPNAMPASVAGRSVLVAPNFKGQLLVETSPNVATATAAHLGSPVAAHRGSPHLALGAALPSAGAVMSGVVAGPTTSAPAAPTNALSVFTLNAAGQVLASRGLLVPASISDQCSGFAWPVSGGDLRQYDSQVLFRGPIGPAAIAVAGPRALVGAVVTNGATPGTDSPINALAVASFDVNNSSSPVAWTVAAWVATNGATGKELQGDFGADGAPGTGDPGEGDGVVDGLDAPIGRLASYSEVSAALGTSLRGPSISAPAFDAAGNVYFIASVLLKRAAGAVVVEEPTLALVRGIRSGAGSCYRLEVMLRQGQIIQGVNSQRSYRVSWLGLADADSVSSSSVFASSATSAAWNNEATLGLPSQSPQHLGGLGLSARIVYDVDNNGQFVDLARPGSVQTSPDEAYNVALLIANTTPMPSQCDSLDFNQDGDFPTPLDLEDFINAVAGNQCPTCNPDLDFNNDGDFPTPLDIEAFISVSAGGPCL